MGQWIESSKPVIFLCSLSITFFLHLLSVLDIAQYLDEPSGSGSSNSSLSLHLCSSCILVLSFLVHSQNIIIKLLSCINKV